MSPPIEVLGKRDTRRKSRRSSCPTKYPFGHQCVISFFPLQVHRTFLVFGTGIPGCIIETTCTLGAIKFSPKRYFSDSGRKKVGYWGCAPSAVSSTEGR